MRLGIDFGTTRTRVAAVLKGNYPLIDFQTESGDIQDWYPSLIAVQGERLAFGLDALVTQYDSDWELYRSLKRLLALGSPQSVLRVGQVELPLMDWLTQFLTTLREDLLRRSNLEVSSQEPLEVMVGIPANANSNQRFMTLEAFRRAGFHLLGMLNEPSAAGIEYAHRYRQSDVTRRREHVVVYDLGGGTFDVSVIRMTGQRHEVLGSDGISQLGGDDFDELLMELALSQPVLADSTRKYLSRVRLLNLCREAKESLNPSSRKITVDLSQISLVAGEVLVPVSQFYEKCETLISKTIRATESAMHSVLGEAGDDLQTLACIYLVGGSSELPVLARSLRDRFGKRVRRSPYPSAATAIGLAIAADQESGYTWEEQFSRHFGVWRESEDGREIVFDPIFSKATPLPGPGQPQLTANRQYHPAHNVGHFRFLECSQLKEQQEPSGDIIAWDEVLFPFDPNLRQEARLDQIQVQRWPEAHSQWVEECYQCDAQGIIHVTISNQTSDYFKKYLIRESRSQKAKGGKRKAMSRRQ
jgi:molecular chaperone DnaK (HSP70)